MKPLIIEKAGISGVKAEKSACEREMHAKERGRANVPSLVL